MGNVSARGKLSTFRLSREGSLGSRLGVAGTFFFTGVDCWSCACSGDASIYNGGQRRSLFQTTELGCLVPVVESKSFLPSADNTSRLTSFLKVFARAGQL